MNKNLRQILVRRAYKDQVWYEVEDALQRTVVSQSVQGIERYDFRRKPEEDRRPRWSKSNNSLEA